MRCKFNQELGGNLLSKTFLLFPLLEKAWLQVLRQLELFANCNLSWGWTKHHRWIFLRFEFFWHFFVAELSISQKS